MIDRIKMNKKTAEFTKTENVTLSLHSFKDVAKHTQSNNTQKHNKT